jgi:hypothetical protein
MSPSFIARFYQPRLRFSTYVGRRAANIAFGVGRLYVRGVQTGTCQRRSVRVRRELCLAAAALIVGAAGCAAPRHTVPPRPPLPAVVFVPPCDPQASIGMTEAGVAQLRARDEAWRTQVEILETIIRGER